MSSIKKAILTLILMAAVIAYTMFNYFSGKISTVYFLVFMVILGIPFINMVSLLIQELKNR